MKKNYILSSIFVILIFASSCKKEDTIINNYNNEKGVDAPKRKLIKSFGFADNSINYSMNYYKDEIGKMEDLTLSNNNIESAKLVFNFDNNGKPKNFQIYTLPSNALSGQGNLVVDSKNRIIKIINLAINSDTNTIISYTYEGADYQPSSSNSYYKSSDRVESYSYYNYDVKGNMIKSITYNDNGTDPIYKSSVIECSTFSEAINPLNQMYYLFMIGNTSGGTQSTIYLSNYFPASIREESYNKNGGSIGVKIENYAPETDADNYVTNVILSGQKTNIIYK